MSRVIAVDFAARRPPTILRDMAAEVHLFAPLSTTERNFAAYRLHVRASEIDEDPTRYAEAIALYTRAITLDPKLAYSYTNLGNVHHRMGDSPRAMALYRQALEIDLRQPEAHYNLGYLLLEEGDARAAIPCFERTLELSSTFADAHFNLASAFQRTGEWVRAREQWHAYLKLEPRGPWADAAREELARVDGGAIEKAAEDLDGFLNEKRAEEDAREARMKKSLQNAQRRAARRRKKNAAPAIDPFLDGMSDWIRRTWGRGRMGRE